jgi:phage terminase large subunit-like protein
VLFVQNLIHSNSIACRLAKAPNAADAATYLMQRIVSGPYKAVEGLQYEQVQDGDLWRWQITAGESCWDGFTLDICEDEINRVGPLAFERESQHDVDGDREGALMTAADFDRTRKTSEQVPDLVRIAIGVDPPGGVTECGIVCVGKVKVRGDWHGFTLDDASSRKGARSEEWALAVLKCYHRNNADVIFVEANYGGDMARGNIALTMWVDDEGNVLVDGRDVRIEMVHATRGKVVRAEPVATVFQQGRGHHVGQFPALEKEWRQYVPGDKDSPNRLDAEVWAYTGLNLLERERKVAKMHNG